MERTYDPRVLVGVAAARGDDRPARIAERVGMPYSSVYHWTRGRPPGSAGLAAIQRAYGLTAAEMWRPVVAEAAA